VKITPAHDPNDFMTGKRHNLEFINVFDDNGNINSNATGQFAGQPRFKVRGWVGKWVCMDGPVGRVVGGAGNAGGWVGGWVAWRIASQPVSIAHIAVPTAPVHTPFPPHHLPLFLFFPFFSAGSRDCG
jgi:hypothetical protein